MDDKAHVDGLTSLRVRRNTESCDVGKSFIQSTTVAHSGAIQTLDSFELFESDGSLNVPGARLVPVRLRHLLVGAFLFAEAVVNGIFSERIA